MSTMSSIEKITMRYWSAAWSDSSATVRRVAATIDPVIEPMPPSTTITTTSIDFTKVNMRGVTSWILWTSSAPASPAKAAEMTKARTFQPTVSTPMASAATSSSRMARSALPCVERSRRRAMTTVATTPMPAQTTLV